MKGVCKKLLMALAVFAAQAHGAEVENRQLVNLAIQPVENGQVAVVITSAQPSESNVVAPGVATVVEPSKVLAENMQKFHEENAPVSPAVTEEVRAIQSEEINKALEAVKDLQRMQAEYAEQYEGEFITADNFVQALKVELPGSPDVSGLDGVGQVAVNGQLYDVNALQAVPSEFLGDREARMLDRAAQREAAGRFGRMRIAVTTSPAYIKAASVLSASKAKVASVLSSGKAAVLNRPKTSIAVATVIAIIGGYGFYKWYSAKPAKKAANAQEPASKKVA